MPLDPILVRSNPLGDLKQPSVLERIPVMRRMPITLLLIAFLLPSFAACGKKAETPAPARTRMVKILTLEGSVGASGRT